MSASLRDGRRLRVDDRLSALRRKVPEPVRRWRRSVRRVIHSAVDSLGVYPDPAECPICGLVVARFLPFQGGGRSPQPASGLNGGADGAVAAPEQRRCPGCGSLERHRAEWLYFQRETNLFNEPVTMLHIAPEHTMRTRLCSYANIEYVTADLDSPAAMVKMDITDIQCPDDSFHVILVNDVLERIRTTSRRCGSCGECCTPRAGRSCRSRSFRADPRRSDDVDPAERERLYGHFDHVQL